MGEMWHVQLKKDLGEGVSHSEMNSITLDARIPPLVTSRFEHFSPNYQESRRILNTSCLFNYFCADSPCPRENVLLSSPSSGKEPT